MYTLHSSGKQCLSENVVDLVRTGVIQILAFQQETNPQLSAEIVAFGENRRTTGVRLQQMVEFFSEQRIGPRIAKSRLELLTRRNQSFGNETPAKLPEPTVFSGLHHGAHVDQSRRTDANSTT